MSLALLRLLGGALALATLLPAAERHSSSPAAAAPASRPRPPSPRTGHCTVSAPVKVGHAAGRFPAETPGAATVATGTDANRAWLASRGGQSSFNWSLGGDGQLRLDYAHALAGSCNSHGITLDHDEETMPSLRWLGEGPARVWQHRLHGTVLGVHETARQVLQPGEAPGGRERRGPAPGARTPVAGFSRAA